MNPKSLTFEQLSDAHERHTAYKLAHSHEGAFACCNAHASADDVPALLENIELLRMDLAMGFTAIQREVDKALGPGESDGAGEGIVADIALLASQRDGARDEVSRLRGFLVSLGYTEYQ